MKSLKNPSVLVLLPLLLVALFVSPREAIAQNPEYWDPGALKASPGSGGTGTWSTGANWWVSGSADTAWVGGDIANFAGTAGTVTVSASQTANGLTFTTPGYILAGSSTLTLAGVTPTITVPAGNTTINTKLAGTAGLSLSGTGPLILGGGNTYTGGTTVGAGSALQLNHMAGAGSGSGAIALGTGSFLITSNRVNNAGITNAITGDASSMVNVILTSGYNTYFYDSLAGFYGTIVITNASGVTGSVLAGINTAAPLTMPATAGGWLVASNAELFIGLPTGVEAAPITINGPGYGAGYGAIRLDSGTVSGNILLNGSTTNNQIGGAGATAVTFSGVISDGGRDYGLNIWGAGSTPASKVFVLSGQNTYGGQTTLSYGETQVGAAENPGVSGPLGRSNALSVIYFNGQANAGANGGALQYSSVNHYDYSGRFATSAGQKYKIDVNGQNVTFANPLTSSGGSLLVFDTAGGGSLTLTAANSYDAGTTLSSGTLKISPTGTIIRNVTVNGGTLELDHAAALASTATLILSNSPAAGAVNLNFSGTQNVAALYFGTALQAVGTWGAPGSSADNQNAAFTGSGILNVTGASLLYWDANGTDAASQSSAFGGGSGIWDSTTAAWWYAGSSDAAWTPNGTATFAGVAGTVTLNANEAANGLTFTTAGYTIAGGSGATLTLSGSTPTVTIPAGTTTIGCNLAGTAGLIESGYGTLVLSGTNTYSGATTLSSGATLRIAGAGQLGSGNYAGNIIADWAAINYNSSAAQTLSGVISGSGATLAQSGPGLLTLAGANTYDSGTSISPGSSLQLTSKNGAGAGTIALTGTGVLSVNTTGANSLANAVANTITGDSSSVINLYQNTNNTYFSSDLSGFNGTVFCISSNSSSSAGNIVVQAYGPLGLPSTSTWNIASGATLILGANGGVCAANVIINGPGNNAGFGALRLDNASVSGNVLLAGAGNNNQIGGTKNNTTCTISGVISDGGLGYGLNRVGYPPAVNSVLALSGQNTYSGVTTLTSNILQVAAAETPGLSGPLGKSAASNPGSIVFAGGTLQYSAANQNDYSGRFSTAANQLYNIDLNGQSVTFATPLSSPGGTLTLGDAAGGGTLILSGVNTCDGGTTINGGTLRISSSGSIGGNLTMNGGALELDNATSLAATCTLTLPESPSGTVNLNFTGTQTISALHFGSVFQAAGTWGAPGSGAANESSAFFGTGILNVTSGRYTSAFWDPSGTAASPGSGGTGIWDNASSNWWAGGTSDTTWAGGATAKFAGTAGTVTLSANTTANGLNFSTPDYILAGSSTLTLGGGAAPAIAIPAGTTTINTPLAGTSGLMVNGPGTLVLGVSNNYSGDTIVSPGSKLQINHVAGAGSSAGTVALGAGGMLITSNHVNNATIANPITGDSTSVVEIILSSGYNTLLSGSLAGFYGTIVITNTGGSDLAGMNTTGPLDMPATAGGWIVSSNAELYINASWAAEAAPITINGPGYSSGYGAIRLDAGTVSGNILLNGSGANNQIGGAFAGDVTFSGVISDAGRNYGLNIWGGGSTPANKAFVLSGQNTYGGPTTLSYGALQLGAMEHPGVSGPLGKSNALSVIYFNAQANAGTNGGALQYSSVNQFDYSSRFAASAGQKYKIDVNGQSVTFASPLASSGGSFLLFDTAGGGTLNLAAGNTYGGGTMVAAGTLHVSSGSIMGAVTMRSGAVLQLDNASSLSLGTALNLVSGATVNLNYGGTQQITGLFVDGAEQPTGVYGAGATNPGGIFTGSGTLTVVGKTSTTISSVAMNGTNQLEVSWPSVPGASYNVYSTTNLVQPVWTLVNSSPIFATGTTISYTLPVAGPQLFVRVEN